MTANIVSLTLLSRGEFSILINVSDMAVDNRSICLEEFAHLGLYQPHGCLFQNLQHISNMQTQMYLLTYQSFSRRSSNDRVMF